MSVCLTEDVVCQATLFVEVEVVVVCGAAAQAPTSKPENTPVPVTHPSSEAGVPAAR